MNPSFLNFLSANHLALAAGCAAGIGMCFFFCGVQLFARKNSSSRLPKVLIRGAGPGLVALSGKATGPRTLLAPISGSPCYLYRTSIWQQTPAGNREWKNVAEETGHLTFLIEDETGQLPVEPSGAELDLRQTLVQDYGAASSPPGQTSNHTKDLSLASQSVPEPVANFLSRNGIALDHPTRVEEYCLQPEMSVSVTGTIVENAPPLGDSAVSSDSPRNPSNAPPASPVPMRPAADPRRPQPEVIRLASGAVPQSTTQMSQQAKIAAALAKAGLAQPDMWAATEPTTPNGASSTGGDLRPAEKHTDSALDTTSSAAATQTFTMTKGAGNARFVISNQSQQTNPSVGWQSVALVLAGSTLTTLGLYVLLFAHLH